MHSGSPELAYQTHHLPPSVLFSRSLREESSYERLPNPWLNWCEDSQTTPGASLTPSGPRSYDVGDGHSQPIPIHHLEEILQSQSQPPPADEIALSPAAMFLSAFSPSSQSHVLPDSEGEIVSGYTLGPIIGQGGFSTIRRASSPTGAVVAIKIVRRSDLARQSHPNIARKRIDHEASVWASLSHEHILPLFSTEHTYYADFFITLYCPAGSLYDILKRDGRPALPQDDAGMMFRQIVRGLRYLHEVAGYVHRDMKLENILVDEMGVCRIGDFGMAKKIGESDADEESQQEDGNDHHRPQHTHARRGTPVLPVHLSLIRHHGGPRSRNSTPVGISTAHSSHQYAHAFQPGSLPYAAPELFLPQYSTKSIRAHPSQDVWALGILLYALLTGRLPFSDSFEPRLQMKILRGVYDMPVGIGRDAEQVLQGCLERSVHNRWTIADIDEMAWGVGWPSEGDHTAAVPAEDDFEFIESPHYRSVSQVKHRQSSRDRPPRHSLKRHSRSRRSPSHASATTGLSHSTRSTSRSVSRPRPPRDALLSPYEPLESSVFSLSSLGSGSVPLYETFESAILMSPPPSVERGRKPKKGQSPSGSCLSSPTRIPTASADFSEGDSFVIPLDISKDQIDQFSSAQPAELVDNPNTNIYAGADALDNTARWALRHRVRRGKSVDPVDANVKGIMESRQHKRPWNIKGWLAEDERRAGSSPPAPDENFTNGQKDGAARASRFLKESIAPSISSATSRKAARSRSVGFERDSIVQYLL